MVEPKQQLSIDRRTLLGWIGGAGILGGSVTGLATALDEDSEDEFTITQGDSTTSVDPIGSGIEAISEYYGGGAERETTETVQPRTGLEEAGKSRLFLYRGAHGLSLVMVHAGGHGRAGAASYTLTGLPSTGEWAVLGDGSEGSGEFVTGDRIARLHWSWDEDGRADGAAFRGLGESFEIQVDAAVDDEAKLDTSGPGSIEGWEFLSGDGGGFESKSLTLGESVAIRGNDCGAGGSTLTDRAVELDHSTDVRASFSCRSVAITAPAYDAVYLTFVDGVNERFEGPFTGTTTFSSTGEYTAKANEIIRSVKVVKDGSQAVIENDEVDACLDGASSCDPPYEF